MQAHWQHEQCSLTAPCRLTSSPASPMQAHWQPEDRGVSWCGHKWLWHSLSPLAHLPVQGLPGGCGSHSWWSEAVPGCREEVRLALSWGATVRYLAAPAEAPSSEEQELELEVVCSGAIPNLSSSSEMARS